MTDLIERLRGIAQSGYGDWSRIAGEAAAALEDAREDSARLDALDAMILDSTERALLLHHGLHKQREPSFCGLGLGNTGRTLRQAIDQARGKGGGEVEGG